MVSDDEDYADLVAQYARHSPPPDPDVQDYDATIIDGSENDEWLTAAQQRRGETIQFPRVVCMKSCHFRRI